MQFDNRMDFSTLLTQTGEEVFARNLRQKDCVDVSRIVKNLYLGSYENGAAGKEGLKFLGITHILTIGHKMPAIYPDDFKYKILEVKDVETATIEEHFPECLRFIEEALKDPSNRVLIHCWAGISRSATITCCYLIKNLAMSYPEAVEHVRRARHWIDPNSGFREKLRSVAASLENENQKDSIAYEKAGLILHFMRDEHQINRSKYDRVVKVFTDIFGPLHPFTLDVKSEMKSFLIDQ
jgi:hypothetical protein